MGNTPNLGPGPTSHAAASEVMPQKQVFQSNFDVKEKCWDGTVPKTVGFLFLETETVLSGVTAQRMLCHWGPTVVHIQMSSH